MVPPPSFTFPTTLAAPLSGGFRSRTTLHPTTVRSGAPPCWKPKTNEPFLRFWHRSRQRLAAPSSELAAKLDEWGTTPPDPLTLRPSPLSLHDEIDDGPRMTPLLTDTLCTSCGLCCDGTLFADVELVGQAELARLEIMGMEVEHEGRNTGLLSQPCAALRGTRCGIYTHRPKCCRVFQCHLLQSAQSGAVTVEQAMEQIAGAREQIRQVRTLLGRLGNLDDDLPIKERCAETLAAEGGTTTQAIQDRTELEAAMATLESTIWNTFLGSGRRRE